MESKDFGFEIAHVGINCEDEKKAAEVAALFSFAFGWENKAGKSSIFSSSGVEVMKSNYLGKMGHIAVKTNDLEGAIEYLSGKGFSFNQDSKKFDENGKFVAIYLEKEFGGFAVHLVQKK